MADLSRRLDYSEINADGARVLQHLAPVEREVRAGEKWFLVRVLPYRTLDDHIAGVVLTFVDITENKRATERLRESERRLQRMVNVPRVGVLTFNHSGEMLDANDAFLEIVGYTREEFTSRTLTWRDFTPPDHVDASWEIMEQLRETGRGGPYEKEYLCKGGTRVWLMFVAADLGDGTIVEYAIDVSDRKRTEEALVESEERLRTLADAVPQIIWTNSGDGTADYFNRRW